ncbi:iron-containing redox enzyme family protein [Actinocrinis puniceicyclus]|uniref:Iron-containing redox enzyme family protein n=1 Tax=Actinocrinis puniceicyclus TaxID=977794 RepID=A0A8J8BD36_9ACTN|nr:iron-containing redox enzyme family protein [Actinocrinis puniceicyclus]MBS2962394.1 iron-containing redox enzyme family protein [Actinocrinis puniceicyclus]
MISIEDVEFKPRLRHCTFFVPNSGAVLMIVGDQHFELEQQGADLKTFLNLKRYLDGRHTIAEISKITGVSVEDTVGIANAFAQQDLLRKEDESLEQIPTETFLKQIDKSTGMWTEQIGYHRLWSGLEKQDYRKEVFLGLVMETYHYIKSASRHVSTAISHCTDPAWQRLLSQYLAEEYDHAWMARECLVRMGMPAEQVDNAHPVIGTWSWINNLCQIAREDTLGYLACTKLFEARGMDTLEGAHTLQSLATAYGYPDGCMDPLVSHVEEDVRAEHTGLLEEALSDRTSVPAWQAHRAVNNLHDLKHSYDQYNDGIILYYSDVSNYIPRLKVDYFSL